MSSVLHCFLLGLLNMLLVITPANCQQSVPTGSWETLSQGIAVSLTLAGSTLTAYVKNTSSSPKDLFGEESHLVRFFYVDSNGGRVRLKDKSDASDRQNSSQANSVTIPQEGAPTFQLQIQLSPDEVTAVKTHPVVCRFRVVDPSTQQYSTLETTPRLLNSST